MGRTMSMGAHGSPPARERPLLEAALRDDGAAFGHLSVQDAVDALQDALLGAWWAAGFEGQPPGSLRRIDVRELDGSENVLVRYEVRPATPALGWALAVAIRGVDNRTLAI